MTDKLQRFIDRRDGHRVVYRRMDTNGAEITPDEWARWQWVDVTELGTPSDRRVFLRVRRNEETAR
jgi:hypothetical protein